MARVLMLCIGCCFALGSCTQRSICPAFQSAYIYDQEALRKKFSYFLDDSTPKVFTASKNKYLVAEAVPYRKKLRKLQTVEMKPVPVQVPDSLTNKDSVSVADLDRAARSVLDTTMIVDVPPREQPPAPAEDSVYVISKDRELRLLKYNGADSLVYDPGKEKYVAQKPEYYVKDVGLNIEQDNYMWYLRDYLVLPDVRLAKLQQSADGRAKAVTEKKKAKKEKKGLKGFFKNLFRKKKEATDSAAAPPPPKEEFDFIDADTISQVTPPANDQQAKKGFFGPGKQASADQPATDPAATNPSDRKKKKLLTGDAEKKRDDGF